MDNELIGFDGKPIKIKRTGWRTPVDVELISNGYGHELRISTNLFIFDDDLPDPEAFEKAIEEGVKSWGGEYLVFDGQKLLVTVDVTVNERFTDSVRVIAVTSEMAELMFKISKNPLLKKFGNGKVDSLLTERRSFAIQGLRKWSIRSKKIIYIIDSDGTFTDFEEIKNVAKHEFGHVLGLGDLYRSLPDGLMGIKRGEYKDLDSYQKNNYKNDYYYDLVMCNNGQISNNDIEMVILAFNDNEMQHYQENYANKEKEKISIALGRGN